MDDRSLERSEAILAREDAAIGSSMKIRFYPFVVATAAATGCRTRTATTTSREQAGPGNGKTRHSFPSL
jgi:hypothetical protein